MSENQEQFKAEGLVYKPEISKCPPVHPHQHTTQTTEPQISNCPPYYPPGHPNHPSNTHSGSPPWAEGDKVHLPSTLKPPMKIMISMHIV